MAKGKKKTQKPAFRVNKSLVEMKPLAKAHSELDKKTVHVFVDDQNLFYGITNREHGRGFRIDFGRLMLAACKDSSGNTRKVGSAYIAGVIPDDDSFWKIAENQGFTVKRGYLGSGNRSKQDDAYLITELTATLFEQQGPATIVLIAGDADYVPPLQRSLEKGWRNEVAFISHGVSKSLEPVTHEFREFEPIDIQLQSSIEY